MSNPRTFRKKPVEIQAMQLIGDNATLASAYAWVESHVGSTKPLCDYADDEPIPSKGVSIDPATGNLEIFTLEGVMQASYGDYIIQSVQGEFYPCKPDIFEAIYDVV